MPMRKYLGAFQAKPEFTKDEIWEYQTKAIAPTIRFLAAHRMSKYFVRRVVKVESGDPMFYDMVEIYWISEQMEKEYYDFLLGFYEKAGLTPPMKAWTRLIIPFWNVTEEVLEIVEADQTEGIKAYKTMTAFKIPEGVKGDEFWKYLTEVHAAEVRKITEDLVKKFSFHRPIKVAAGSPTFYAISEIWWASKEARDKFNKLAQKQKTASGKTLAQDFESRTSQVWSVEIETKQFA